MAYCTPQDVEDAYGTRALAQATGDQQGQTIDSDKVDRAIEEYAAHIEMHVRAQHPDNPFDEQHTYLNALNVEGAFLTIKRKTPSGLGEQQQRAQKRLDDILMGIASGQVTLFDADQEADADEDGTLLDPDELVSANRRVFGLDRRYLDYRSL